MSVNWLLNRTLLVSIAFLMIFSSCKKDRLNGEKEIFVGEWEWVYSIEERPGGGFNATSYRKITPDTEKNNYSMTFLKRGKVIFYKNGEEVERKRLGIAKSRGVFVNNASLLGFDYYLNNNPEYTFSGGIKKSTEAFSVDTLVLDYYFPYDDHRSSTPYYHQNFFIRK